MVFPGIERIIVQGRIWLQDAYFKIKEISATEFTSEPGTQPTTPPADHFYVYGKAISNVATPHWKDENGVEHVFADVASAYTDEQAQDAVGGILVDSSTVDLTYNDGVPSITAAVIPGGIDHGGLADLTADDHTQYVLRSILTTNGDLFTRLAGVIARLGVGSEGQVLTVASGLPAWEDPTGGSGGDSGGHLHGMQRTVLDGSATTINLLDIAEYLEHALLNGTGIDPLNITLSSDRSQITLASAGSAGDVLELEYVIAGV